METLKGDDMLNQDPDYSMLFKTDLNRQNVFEYNARTNAAKKISTIIEAEFLKEIESKKIEIFNIYKNLNKACKMLHYLRFAIVTDFYNQENTCINDTQALKQTRPHWTIKPSRNKLSLTDMGYTSSCLGKLEDSSKRKRRNSDEQLGPAKRHLQNADMKNTITATPVSSINTKTRKRIIIGNISKWIPPDFREDKASHKWTVYIRDSQKSDIGQFISKVRFFLHPSYKPNDVIELTSPPFHLSRLGWGEFPIRVQLHFANTCDKPVDIIHHLKLDRTFTGLQTIGSETIVDIWITLKDIPIVSNLVESNKQNITFINEQCKNSDLIKPCHFLNDHDYISTNSRLPYSITADSEDACLNNHLNAKKREDVTIKDEIEKEKEIRFKEETDSSNTFKQQKLLNNSECRFKNILLEDKQSIEYVNNVESSSISNSNTHNKKIYFKHNSTSEVENFKILVNLIKQVKSNSLFSILKFVANRMPLITPKSVDSSYKMMHPYASENYQVFSNYSKAKQRSIERYRAMSALNIMKNVKGDNEACNIKEFMIWARRYCYTPFINFKNVHKICLSNVSIEHNEKYKHTSTTSHELNMWLLKCQKINPNTVNFNHESDSEVDIENIPANISDSSLGHKDFKLENNPAILMEYPETKDCLKEFVFKTTQQIGIKLINEEIIPGVSHCTASVLMTTAIKCLIDELVRLAFSNALDRCQTEGIEVSINLEDVRMALLKKEELEIFTNAGLGSEG